MKKTLDTEHRVIHLPESLKEAIKVARDAKSQTNEEFVGETVAEILPRLVQQLEAIGFANRAEARKPARLPFSSERGTLRALRDAAQQLQLPANRLLELCLLAATQGEETIPISQEATPTEAVLPEPSLQKEVSPEVIKPFEPESGSSTPAKKRRGRPKGTTSQARSVKTDEEAT